MKRHDDICSLQEDFLQEYTAAENIRKYVKNTAGYGISYLLDHDYGDLYWEVIDKILPPLPEGRGLRLLEFGCGAGMNLLHLVSALERRKTPLDSAFGTDFSASLIEAANRETETALTPQAASKVRFCVAKNESLHTDLAGQLHVTPESLEGSFDLIFGINTIRYCHRLKKAEDNAQDIYRLLRDQGVCMVVDMNDKFPAFRGQFRDWRTKSREAYYLPSLDEYARPFESANFKILRKTHFCWVPHSAGKRLVMLMLAVSPLLNCFFRKRAMRSLVISQK